MIRIFAGRPAVDIKWVEMEIGLHRSVVADKLILVSESGFSAPAREKAEAEGAIPIQPSDFDSEDAVGKIVNRLGTIYPKFMSLTPQRIAGRAEKPDGAVAVRRRSQDISPPSEKDRYRRNLLAAVKPMAASLVAPGWANHGIGVAAGTSA